MCLFSAYRVETATDARIATLMVAMNNYRKAVRANAAVCKPVFATAAERAQYETLWRDQCYTPAFQARGATVDKLTAILSNNALVARISAMKKRLPSRENPVAVLGRCIDAMVAGPIKEQYELLKCLDGTTDNCWSLPLIPKLVSLYQWLYDALGNTITQEDAFSLSMQQVFVSASQS